MSKFPYDAIAPEAKWTIVSGSSDRAAIVPQGPAKFALDNDASIASAGSCFAQRLAERLPRFGLSYTVAEPGAEPYSARYGNIYTARQLSQLFSRAFGRFQPRENAWQTERGTFVDPFRPLAVPEEFASIEELEGDRATHLRAVRTIFETIDVFVFTLGLTELWYDVRDGAVFPSCPGRGVGTFDADRFALAVTTVEETEIDLARFLDDLHEVNPRVRVILTVSPVPNAATMQPTHIVRASVLAKSTLKVAAEAVARERANVDYFAVYDWVSMNLGGREMFLADGRNVSPAVADRATEMLVRHYFVNASKRAGAAPQAFVGADCDEDRLLALIVSKRSGVASGAVAGREAIARPTPLYFIGDSSSVIFRNAIFTLQGFDEPFLGIGYHIRRLRARDLADLSGRINPSVLKALVTAELLNETVDGSYSASRHYDRALGRSDEGYFSSPILTLCCGFQDVADLAIEFYGRAIDLPDDLRPGFYPGRYDDDVPYDNALAVAIDALQSFAIGVELLKSYGLGNLAVQMVAPPEPSADLMETGRGLEVDALHIGLTIVFNEALRAICARRGVIFLDYAAETTLADGRRDAAFSLDSVHLNEAASQIAVRKLVRAIADRTTAHV